MNQHKEHLLNYEWDELREEARGAIDAMENEPLKRESHARLHGLFNTLSGLLFDINFYDFDYEEILNENNSNRESKGR